jgi:hypothetical protein
MSKVRIKKFNQINENRIVIQSHYMSIINYFLDKLGLDLHNISDIFSDLMDFNFNGNYLQLFYWRKSDNTRWNSIREEGNYVPYIIVSFSSPEEENIISGYDIRILESFIESFNILKSNLDSDFKLEWNLREYGISINIYLNEEIDKEFYLKLIYGE